MNSLTKPESKRLAALEGVIDAGQKQFVAVGQALAEIRDSKLYRETHGSFDAYCQARWNWKKAHAYRLIEAAEVCKSPIGDSIANEAQAREVAKVPAADRPAVVAAAVERAEGEGRDLTARDIADAAKPTYSTLPQETPHLSHAATTAPALTQAEVALLKAVGAPSPEWGQTGDGPPLEEDDALEELMLGVCSLAQSITRSADKMQMQGFSRRLRGLAALAEEIAGQM